jgi:hypothetical protein
MDEFIVTLVAGILLWVWTDVYVYKYEGRDGKTRKDDKTRK